MKQTISDFWTALQRQRQVKLSLEEMKALAAAYTGPVRRLPPGHAINPHNAASWSPRK